MRKLLWLIGFAALLWAGYWMIAGKGLREGLARWLDARAAEGWQAEAGDVAVSGFPLRFDAAISDLALADPETGLAWMTPEFRFAAAAWAPTDVTADWPRSQVIATPLETIEVTSDRMTGRLALRPEPALALAASEIAVDGMRLRSSAGWESALQSGTLNLVRAGEGPASYDLVFSANEFRPAKSWLLALDPTGQAPEVLSRLTLDAQVAFDRPWDRRAVEERRPQPTAVRLRGLAVRWGAMELEAAGGFTVDAAGVPDGRITLRAVNWREMLRIAEASGAVPEALSPTAEGALEVLAGLSGNPETIDAPLAFRNGFVSFGPVPLGPAPRLRLR